MGRVSSKAFTMNFLVICAFVVTVFGLWCCEGSQEATQLIRRSLSIKLNPEISCGVNRKFYIVLNEKIDIAYVACFDEELKNSVFTIHHLDKSNIKDTGGYSKVFKAEDHLGHKDINSYYKQHTKKFMDHFHEKYDFCTYEYFAGPNNYLARGHLVPDADFNANVDKKATYNYINTAPQFQKVNEGDWLRVEDYVREIAEKFKFFLKNPRNLNVDKSEQERQKALVKYKISINTANKSDRQRLLTDYKLRSQNTHAQMAAHCETTRNRRRARSASDRKKENQSKSVKAHDKTRQRNKERDQENLKKMREIERKFILAQKRYFADMNPITVMTGVLGNTQIKEEDLYLADKKIPVPHLFWKVVIYHKDCNVNLIFLRTNYYYDKLGSICSNICENIGFLRSKDQAYAATDIEEENEDENAGADDPEDSTVCCYLNSFFYEDDNKFSKNMKPYRIQIRENLESVKNLWETK
uniref:Salivary endonuclease n=1 Tax=Sergentomyia schwetzi TaxID=114605 RepID=A0A6B9VKF6_9DIPT|nr:salivary endonuclease [Sergentomyia schwetzi]